MYVVLSMRAWSIMWLDLKLHIGRLEVSSLVAGSEVPLIKIITCTRLIVVAVGLGEGKWAERRAARRGIQNNPPVVGDGGVRCKAELEQASG